MIKLFRNFNETSYIAKAFAIWSEAEPIALELMSIGDKLQKEVSSTSPSQDKINSLLASIGPVNKKLTLLEDESPTRSAMDRGGLKGSSSTYCSLSL